MSELRSKDDLAIYRCLTTGTHDAVYNMAVDEALLKCFNATQAPILRLYSWSDSFSLGVSQKIEDYESFCAPHTSFAKRMTGGGVLFHGHDISYSIIVPSGVFGALGVKESYERICSFLLVFYEELGLSAVFAKDKKDITLSHSSYCQVGFEPYDILINDKKIGGNAQRRMKDKIFQHGSIPLKSNDTYQQMQGYNLQDFGISLSLEEATTKLTSAFCKSFAVSLVNSDFTEEEKQTINTLMKEKYANSPHEKA